MMLYDRCNYTYIFGSTDIVRISRCLLNGSVFLLINIVSAAIVCNGGVLIVGGGLAAGPVAIGGEAHGRRGGRGLS